MIKINFLILLMMLSIFSIKAQLVESSTYNILLKGLLSHTVNEVSVMEVKDSTEIIFIDSRERKEFEVSHIHNAIWVGYDNLNLKPLKSIDKDKKIVVYCSVGYRSEKVAEKLKSMGYTNVSNLYGGIFEWSNQDLPLVNMSGELTDSVHAYNKTWGIWLNKGKKVYK